MLLNLPSALTFISSFVSAPIILASCIMYLMQKNVRLQEHCWIVSLLILTAPSILLVRGRSRFSSMTHIDLVIEHRVVKIENKNDNGNVEFSEAGTATRFCQRSRHCAPNSYLGVRLFLLSGPTRSKRYIRQHTSECMLVSLLQLLL